MASNAHENGPGARRPERRVNGALEAIVDVAIIYCAVFGMEAAAGSGLLTGIGPATVERIRQERCRSRSR